MMMSSMRPMTASKAASAAEELEGQKQEIKIIISLKGRLKGRLTDVTHNSSKNCYYIKTQ